MEARNSTHTLDHQLAIASLVYGKDATATATGSFFRGGFGISALLPPLIHGAEVSNVRYPS
jgi:hypothetical protein